MQGTNGGVTRLGLTASALGGLCIGVAFYLASLISPSILRDAVIRQSAVQQILVVPLGKLSWRWCLCSRQPSGSHIKSSASRSLHLLMQICTIPCGPDKMEADLLAGLLAGFFGSVVDSVFGATVQFTGYNRRTLKITSKINDDVTPISGLPILDNNAVNLVSASLLSFVSALVSLHLIIPVQIIA